jgi:hypothetical protein
MKSSFSTRVADDDGAARKRARYEPTGLLPAILACCEAHSPHVDATEIASFLQGSGASLAELEASGAEELSQQVASVWAAKLLLQVSAPSYSSRTAQRPRLSAASPYGAAGACSSAAGCGGAADLHSTAAAPTSAAHKALRVEAGLGSPPCTSEEERSRCDDVDSASDHEPDRRTAGAGGGDGGDGGGGGGGVGGYAAAATRTSFHREPLEELEEEAAGERCGGVGAEADGADADDDAFDELADGYDDGYGKGGGGKQSRRLVWTDSLHRAFEAAVAQLGSESARTRDARPASPPTGPPRDARARPPRLTRVRAFAPAQLPPCPSLLRIGLSVSDAKPQAIQQLMGVDGITTRNIKSHLQVRPRAPATPSPVSLPPLPEHLTHTHTGTHARTRTHAHAHTHTRGQCLGRTLPHTHIHAAAHLFHPPRRTRSHAPSLPPPPPRAIRRRASRRVARLRSRRSTGYACTSSRRTRRASSSPRRRGSARSRTTTTTTTTTTPRLASSSSRSSCGRRRCSSRRRRTAVSRRSSRARRWAAWAS